MKRDNFFHQGTLSLILISLFLLISAEASAHKVNVFAYVEGDTVYCEGYFPDGRKVEGGKIEVYDSQENKLLEGTTDKTGVFNFKVPKIDDLKIVLNASMGHKNSYTLSADELIEAAPALTDPTGQVGQAPAKTKPGDRPLKKEPLPIAAILGGLGFIFGLTALILQLTSRKGD